MGFPLGFVILVDKVASVPKTAMTLIKKSTTFFCLVLRIYIIVLLQLVRTVGKLAISLVGAKSELHKLSAELRFLFVKKLVFWNVFGRIGFLSGKGTCLLLTCVSMLTFLSEHSSAEHVIPIDNIFVNLIKAI